MAGSFACLYYHIVFSTKDRLPLITPEVAPRIFEYMGGIIRGTCGASVCIGGTSDHAHLLTSFNKDRAVSDCVRIIKSQTSGWIHETFPQMHSFSWQEGYGAFSISVTGLERVKGYIMRQAEHHRKVTFKEEFIAFLEQHQIPYDERYIWK